MIAHVECGGFTGLTFPLRQPSLRMLVYGRAYGSCRFGAGGGLPGAVQGGAEVAPTSDIVWATMHIRDGVFHHLRKFVSCPFALCLSTC